MNAHSRANQETLSSAEEGIFVDGSLRARKNSRGDPIDVSDAGIANFWRWYGDGPTDKAGRPIVLHHGTSKVFDAFVAPKNGRFDGEAGTIYFTEDPVLAKGYGPVVLDVYVRMSAALVYDTGMRAGMSDQDFDSATPTLRWPDGRTEHCNWGDWWITVNPTILPVAKQIGGDSLILRGIKDNAAGVLDDYRDVYVAFDAKQVKSVANTLIWDKEAPRLVSEESQELIHEACRAVARKFQVPMQTVFDVATRSPTDLIARSQEEYLAAPNQMQSAKTFPRHPLGAARLAEYGGDMANRYVDFLQEFDARELVTAEAEQGIKSHPSYQAYRDWAQQGNVPPYISVYETDSGKLQSTNRRRTLVAQELGTTITGWLGRVNRETGQPLKYGDLLDAYRNELERLCTAKLDNDQPRSLTRRPAP